MGKISQEAEKRKDSKTDKRLYRQRGCFICKHSSTSHSATKETQAAVEALKKILVKSCKTIRDLGLSEGE